METTVQLSSPVEDFFISDDGNRLAVLDAYGTVTCHDCANGEKLWSCQQASQNYLLDGPGNTVLAIGSGGITALSLESGECLWNYDSRYLTDQQGVLSADRTMIAFAEQKLMEVGGNYEFTVVVLSAVTGEVIIREVFAEGATVTPAEDIPYVVLQDVLGGFDADNSRFAGSFVTQAHIGICRQNYFLVDLASGKTETVCSKPLSGDPYSQSMKGLYFDKENSIIALHALVNSASAAVAEKLDLAGGTTVWEMTTTAESSAFRDQDPVCWVRTDAALYLARENHVYAIDPQLKRMACVCPRNCWS